MKIALMTVALAGLALGACAPRHYDDRTDRYYSDRYTPTPHGGLEYTDRDPHDPGPDRHRDYRDHE